MNYKSSPTIRSWAEADRPREKLLQRGKNSLSDAELLAILLGSGSRNESALDLARRVLSNNENDLFKLGKLSASELKKFRGLGPAKAASLLAAFELGRRRTLKEPAKRLRITNSNSAFQALAPILSDLPHEEFWILYLNRANEVIGKEQLSAGGTAGTVVDLKIFFKKALDARASSVIAAHNHPSGNLQPSEADIALTQRLYQSGKLLDLPLLDHLIISERGYYSFADEGRIGEF